MASSSVRRRLRVPPLAAVTLLAAVFVAVSSLAAFAAGSVVTGYVDRPLSTSSSTVGERVILNDVSGAGISGAKLYGHVAAVQRAGQGRKAELKIDFDKIVFANGQSQPVSGHVTSMQEKKTGTSPLVKQAGGALIGDIAGNYIGKHLGTNLGGLVGAAGGYLYARNSQNNFSVAQGTQMTVQLNQVVRRQAR